MPLATTVSPLDMSDFAAVRVSVMGFQHRAFIAHHVGAAVFAELHSPLLDRGMNTARFRITGDVVIRARSIAQNVLGRTNSTSGGQSPSDIPIAHLERFRMHASCR